MTEKGNIFRVEGLAERNEERFDALVTAPGLTIERIVSTGQATPEGAWYDQECDEWVILLTGSARVRFDDDRVTDLSPGDYLLIPAHCRHRVEYTTADPPCIWIAVHGTLIQQA